MNSTKPIAEHFGSAYSPEAHSQETVHRFHVKSADVGILGFVDGGTLLDWIDIAAYATATQWCGGHCVAASVGTLHVDRPISVGEVAVVHASLVYTGHSTMHILVTIQSGDPTQANAVQTAQCPIIFVAVDSTGQPLAVPQWTPVTMLELQRHRQARVRIRMRKRIEGAMPAQSDTAHGTGPGATMRFRAANDINRDNIVRAGRVMRWIDESAARCAADWTGADVVTSYVAGIRFHRPIVVGDVVEATARIVHTGPRSIHTVVQVTSTAPHGGQRHVIADGLLVVVALDERGAARSVPKWEPASDEDHRLDQHALHLIELRQFNEPFTIATADVLRC